MKTFKVVDDCVVDADTNEIVYDDMAGRVGEIVAFLLTDKALLKADLKSAQLSIGFYEERMHALQKYQKELPEPYRTTICNILANGTPRP